MKKSVMVKWVAALRSGKYKQTRNQLHNPKGDGYCCLGVLCKISGKEFNSVEQFIPQNIRFWAGLKSNDGNCCDTELKGCSLATYNDNSKYSFKKIADIIEKNYKKL